MIENHRTILTVPTAHVKYAKEHGAQYDACDQLWFFLGDVPEALMSYVKTSPRPRDYTQEKVPACPNCHAGMVVRRSRAGDHAPFWGCSRFPSCHGTRPLDEAISDTQWQRAPEPLFEPSAERASADDVDSELRKKITETLVLCRMYLPQGEQWKVWLRTPRVRFGNRSAMDVMITVQACEDVQELLHETFEQVE